MDPQRNKLCRSWLQTSPLPLDILFVFYDYWFEIPTVYLVAKLLAPRKRNPVISDLVRETATLNLLA